MKLADDSSPERCPQDAPQPDEDDEDDDFIVSAILDLSLDPEVAVGKNSPNSSDSATFERRGCSLAVLESIAKTARRWRGRRRVLLSTGETGIVLRKSNNADLWVQVRRIGGIPRETVTVEREYRCVPATDVAHTLVACIGERVDVQLAQAPRLHVKGSQGAAVATDSNWPGTVVGFDATRHRYIVERCEGGTDPTTSNYTLNWQPDNSNREAVEEQYLVVKASFTTKDACEELVQPLTRRSGRSLVAALAAVDEDAASAVSGEGGGGGGGGATNHAPFVGEAASFISHAWKYEFADAISSLSLWRDSKQSHTSAATETTSVFVWFDIATVPQHHNKQLSLPENFFYNEFREGIKSIGSTVLIAIPMLNPIPLTRAWCVWEIYCSLEAGARFETALTPADQRYRDTHSLRFQIKSDATQATSWLETDTQRILAACAGMGGCQVIDEMVVQAFALDQVQHSITMHKKTLTKMKLNQLLSYEDTPPQFLNFSGMTFGLQAAQKLADYFEELEVLSLEHDEPPLRHLSFLNVDFSPASSATTLVHAIGRAVGLSKLFFHFPVTFLTKNSSEAGETAPRSVPQQFGHETGMALAQAVSVNLTLRHITLDGSAIGASAFAELLRAVASSSVVELNVTGHQDTDSEGSVWCTPEEEGETGAGAQTEPLENAAIIGTGAQALADALAKSTRLMIVNTSGRVNDKSMSLFAAALRSNPSSVVLKLGLGVIPRELQEALLKTNMHNISTIREDDVDLNSLVVGGGCSNANHFRWDTLATNQHALGLFDEAAQSLQQAVDTFEAGSIGEEAALEKLAKFRSEVIG
jgi:hypothetical protein